MLESSYYKIKRQIITVAGRQTSTLLTCGLRVSFRVFTEVNKDYSTSDFCDHSASRDNVDNVNCVFMGRPTLTWYHAE
jgi:hypothetical protein